MTRMNDAIQRALDAGRKAVRAYGNEAQIVMVFEEMAELQLALARDARGRETHQHILEEAADVIITVLQLGTIYGPDVLIDMLELKTRRLEERVSAKLAVIPVEVD